MKTIKKTKVEKLSYSARAQIVASISGDMEDVTLSALDGDYNRHAVFSLAESSGFERGLAEKFLHMARVAKQAKPFRYDRRPTEREVAVRFVRSLFPHQTPRLQAIQSCYTPGGWVWPAPPGEQCKSFFFYEPALNFAAANRNLVLRFAVSVHVTKVARAGSRLA